MIDLNKKVTPEVATGGAFEPLEPGEYLVKLSKFGKWEKRNKNGVDFHMAKVEIEIIGDQGKGRKVFDNLLIHPNTPWQTPQFLAAFGDGEDLAPADFNTLVGNEAIAVIEINEYTKTIVDKTTGAEEEELRRNNAVNYYKPVEEIDFGDIFDN